MIQNLTISPHNTQAHIDIEHDIQKQKDGLFTFILRIDNGNIVDYNVIAYVDIRDYLQLTKVVVQESFVSHTVITGSK